MDDDKRGEIGFDVEDLYLLRSPRSIPDDLHGDSPLSFVRLKVKDPEAMTRFITEFAQAVVEADDARDVIDLEVPEDSLQEMLSFAHNAVHYRRGLEVMNPPTPNGEWAATFLIQKALTDSGVDVEMDGDVDVVPVSRYIEMQATKDPAPINQMTGVVPFFRGDTLIMPTFQDHV